MSITNKIDKLLKNDAIMNKFKLNGKDIRVKMEQISEALKVNTIVTDLYLSSCNIDTEGAKYLSEALKVNTTLRFINIRNNHIGSEGVKHLCEALKINTMVHTLDLGNNNICTEGVKYLSEILKVNTTLIKVSLWRNNNIGSEGVKHLSEALKVNTSLTTLDLRYNGEGAGYLLEALTVNTTLTDIAFSNDNDDNDDIFGSIRDRLRINKINKERLMQLQYLCAKKIGEIMTEDEVKVHLERYFVYKKIDVL